MMLLCNLWNTNFNICECHYCHANHSLQAVELEPSSSNQNFDLLFSLNINFSSKIYYNHYGINWQVTANQTLRDVHVDVL